MAALSQSRKPEGAAEPLSAEAASNPSTGQACISLRLWLSGRPDASLTVHASGNPAVCLIHDLVAASEGQLVASRGGVLVAGFLSYPAAILAARRLQWAFQGFSESSGPRSAALALLVHSLREAPSETSGGAVLRSLGEAAPGAILLTEAASRPLDGLPGLPLRASSIAGLRELLWRGADGLPNRSGDETILTHLIDEAQNPPPITEQLPAPDFAAAEPQDSPEPRRHGWLISGLALATLAIAAVAYLHFVRGMNFPFSAQDQEQTANQLAPATTAPTVQAQPLTANLAAPSQPASLSNDLPSATPTPANPAPSGDNHSPAAPKAAKTLPKIEIKPATIAIKPTPSPVAPSPARVSNERCDLEPNEYSGQIDLAWKNLGRGRYADAKRQFSAVLACDPGNARAREGLERARMAANAEGQPEN